MKSGLDSIPKQHADDEMVLSTWEKYYDHLSNTQAVTVDPEATRETLRRQVEVAEKLLAKDPNSPYRQYHLAFAYRTQGQALHSQKEWALARVLYGKALALNAKAAEGDSNPILKVELAFSQGAMGSLRRDEGDLDGALDIDRKALQLIQEVSVADPENPMVAEALVFAHRAIAGVLARKGDLDGAVAKERAILQLRTDREKTHPSPYGNAAWEASLHQDFGHMQALLASQASTPRAHRRDHWRRARAEYSKALTTWLELAKSKPLQGEYAAYPGQLQESITKCDEELVALVDPLGAVRR